MFEGISFIKTAKPHVYEYTLSDPAPLFRRCFTVEGTVKQATLNVCGLGYAYYYLNCEPVSADLFTAPASNYNKTLWYNTYDVTDLVQTGENVAAVIVGNGEYNETINTPWDINKAEWRDNPKFIFQLEIRTDAGVYTVVSDASWKCTNDSPVLFNQLRNGEYYDSRVLNAQWRNLDFDDGDWEQAVVDQTPPKGSFRKCVCEPIREMQLLKPKSISKTKKGTYLFTYDQNISGYVRLTVREKCGTVLSIKYGERIDETGCINSDWVDPQFYAGSIFQTDKFICNGEECVWSPRFTYHGFSFIEIEGMCNEPDAHTAIAVFAHQAVAQISTFECANELLNKIYHCGIMSTKSNLHYLPTDCPTREKLGWVNDAFVSMEQFLTNFAMEKVLGKWFVDILDAMTEAGEIPAIVPTPGWGYDWGSGPLMGSILFELPYRVYEYTGNMELLKKAFSYFKKYLNFIKSKKTETGLVDFGLADWAGPFEDLTNPPTPRAFSDTALYMRLLKIAAFAAEKVDCCNEKPIFEQEYRQVRRDFKKAYINEDGTCRINEQTALALLVYHDFYEDGDRLKKQLKELVEHDEFHLDCGMIGMRYLFHALNRCGLPDYAYRILCSSGYPSYSEWIDNGATTLWETWQGQYSKNHHLFSDVLSWMMKTVVGISPTIDDPAFKTVKISPVFFGGMAYAKGSIRTNNGLISVEWNRTENVVSLLLHIPPGTVAHLKLGNTVEVLQAGMHKRKIMQSIDI